MATTKYEEVQKMKSQPEYKTADTSDTNIKINYNSLIENLGCRSTISFRNVKFISKCRRVGNAFEFLVHRTDNRQAWIKESYCKFESLIRPILHKTYPEIKTIYLVCRTKRLGFYHGDEIPKELQTQIETMKNAVSKYQTENVEYRIKVIIISKIISKNIPMILYEISGVAQEGDIFAIYRADRLTEDPSLTLQLFEDIHNSGVKSCSIMHNMWYNEQKTDFIQVILNANREREIRSKKLLDVFETKKKRGDVMGRIPYGKKLVKSGENGKMSLVDNEEEQAIIKEIRELKKKMYRYDIVDYINSKYKMRGREFTISNIKLYNGYW